MYSTYFPFTYKTARRSSLGLMKMSAWSRLTGNLNKYCNTKRLRIFIQDGDSPPKISGKKGERGDSRYGNAGVWQCSTYGIYVGKEWVRKEYSFVVRSVDHVRIIKKLYKTVPEIKEKSYKECLKYEKMIAFA